MTVRSIPAQGAGEYADYLESKTIAPGAGDYYLGPEGEPVEAPGRWLAGPQTLGLLSIRPGVPVGREELVALMQGRRPGSDEFVRPAGPTGTRNAGVDVVLSAPKSLSVAWALADDDGRQALWDIHAKAVERAMGHVRDTVPLTTERMDGRNRPAVARDLIAAEFRHSTARGLAGRVPDPQLHSHVVITSVLKAEGRVAAVRDREMYRAAREGGAYYRAALAEGLQQAGYEVKAGTGKDGRYFELAHVNPEVIDAFSGRAREIERIVHRFEAREGRKPSEAELQLIKVDSRAGKLPHTQHQLTQAWQQTAADHDQHPVLPSDKPVEIVDYGGEWGRRVELALTAHRATFPSRELRATALEQGTGTMSPQTALQKLTELEQSGQLLELRDGRYTTGRLRAMEAAITHNADLMTQPDPGRRPVPDRAIQAAEDQVAERIGSPLSPEQQHAVSVLTGPGRIAALEGQAGTGKGLVIDTVARVERMIGRQVIGTATAGATAQRLGQDSPALHGRTTTIASLLARHDQHGQILDPDTTVFVDETGMIDTPTLDALVRVCDQTGAKLIAVGDGKQLPAIGPGGMFDQLTAQAPKATLTQVRRTKDPAEQRAWRALRNGHPDKAMAHYLARRQLHMADTRDHALHQAVDRYTQLTEHHGLHQVALMSDGPGHEIDRMNARAQHHRQTRQQVTGPGIAIPDTDPDTPPPHYQLHQGDLVTWRQIQTVPGDARIENGSRGIITHTHPDNRALQITLVGSDREVTVTGDEIDTLRLGYAQHVVRQQGATVQRAVVLTGGWQTNQEGAYVQASRARDGVDWHVARDQLGQDGTDPDRIRRLAERMTVSAAKTPSITQPLAANLDPALHPAALPTPETPLPVPAPSPSAPEPAP